MASDPRDPRDPDEATPASTSSDAASSEVPAAAPDEHAPDEGTAVPDEEDVSPDEAGLRDGALVPGPLEAGEDDEPVPLEEVVTTRPVEAAAPVRGPLPLLGTGVAGLLMGTADVMPGFSGGTVALVVGIYERLIANVRQGARGLSLLVRRRPQDAVRAVLAIEWPFVAALLGGILVAIFTLAGTLRLLIEEQPVLLNSAFFGLVLGAAVVAAREVRSPAAWHSLVGIVAAVLTFIGLGFGDGGLLSPSPLTFLVGGALAISAMILPGVSGSFLLVVLGLYEGVIDAAADRDLVLLAIFAVGCVAGLAGFSTLLNWLLARFHDVVLVVLIGLMVGSARVLWPYPSDAGFTSQELGPPEGTGSLLALAVALTAFALVWMLSLLATGVQRRRARRRAVTIDGPGDDPTPER